jgi:hypothetical protein
LGEVAYVMFSVGEWTWELIIYLPDNLKNDFGEFDEAISRCRKAIRNYFLHSGNSKKWFARSRGSVVLSSRKALITHNLPSGYLNKRLCWSQWCDFSRCRKAMRSHFVIHGHRKFDMDEVSYFMFYVAEVMFEIGEWPWVLIICLLGVLKDDFGEFEEAMFRGVERTYAHFVHSEHRKKRLVWSRLCDVLSTRMVNCLLNVLKIYFGGQWNNVSLCRKAIWKNFLSYGHWKKRFGLSCGSDVLSKRMALRTHNLPSWRLKKRLVKTRKRRLKVSKGQTNIFFHSEYRKKRLSWCGLSDVWSTQMGLKTHNLPFERLKIRLWWCRWRDVSWCRKAIRTHFLNFGHSKNIWANSQKLCFKYGNGLENS